MFTPQVKMTQAGYEKLKATRIRSPKTSLLCQIWERALHSESGNAGTLHMAIPGILPEFPKFKTTLAAYLDYHARYSTNDHYLTSAVREEGELTLILKG